MAYPGVIKTMFYVYFCIVSTAYVDVDKTGAINLCVQLYIIVR